MPQTFWDMFGGCCGLRKRRPSNTEDMEHQPILASPHHGTASIHSSIIPSPYIPARDDGGYGSTGAGGDQPRGKISEEKRVRVEEIGRDVGARMMPFHAPFTRILTSPKAHANTGDNADASGSSTHSSSPSSTSKRHATYASPGRNGHSHAQGLGSTSGTGAREGKESDLRKEVFSDEDIVNTSEVDASAVDDARVEVDVDLEPREGNTTTATSSPLSSAPPSLASPKKHTVRLPSTLDKPGATQSEESEVRKVSLGISGAFGPVGAAGASVSGEGQGIAESNGPMVGVVRGGGRGGRARGRGRGKGRGKK